MKNNRFRIPLSFNLHFLHKRQPVSKPSLFIHLRLMTHLLGAILAMGSIMLKVPTTCIKNFRPKLLVVLLEWMPMLIYGNLFRSYMWLIRSKFLFGEYVGTYYPPKPIYFLGKLLRKLTALSVIDF